MILSSCLHSSFDVSISRDSSQTKFTEFFLSICEPKRCKYRRDFTSKTNNFMTIFFLCYFEIYGSTWIITYFATKSLRQQQKIHDAPQRFFISRDMSQERNIRKNSEILKVENSFSWSIFCLLFSSQAAHGNQSHHINSRRASRQYNQPP